MAKRLASALTAPVEVSIHLLSEDIFLHPPPPNSDSPEDGETLRGVVELKVPSERTIHGVKVTLQGLQTLALPEPASSATGGSSSMRNEEKVIFDRQLEITSDGSGGLAHAHKGSKGKGKAREVQQPSVTPVSTPIHERPPELHAEQESVPAEDGIWLQKGTTGFEFSFIIPSSSPPFERHRYGRVRYGITATALGGGRGRSGVSAWREVFIMLHVSPDGGPSPLDIQYHDVHDALGFMSVSLTSASLTVGGTAILKVTHPEPPPGLSVHVIRVFLEQTVELFSEQKKGWLKLPLEKHRIWERGYLPFKAKQSEPHLTPEDAFWLSDPDGGKGRLGRAAQALLVNSGHASPCNVPQSNSTTIAPGMPSQSEAQLLPAPQSSHSSGYKIRATVRLPDDNTIRPSTVRGSKAEIRISHDLGVEVYFSRLSVLDERENSESFGKPKVQVFSMRRGTVIPSCCCTFDTIHLPPYSVDSPSSSRPESPMLAATSRSTTQGDIDHWRLTQTLRAAFSHASGPSPQSSGTPGSRPDSRNGSRDPSPTRRPQLPHHGSFTNFFHGRKSRNSSPERGAADTAGTSPSSSNHQRRGRVAGLHGFTPAHASGPQQTSVTTAPASGTTTPKSLPASYPWAQTHLPARTPTSHDTCNCGRTTEELVEAEQRLLDGAPTAPGQWSQRHDEGATPPSYTPSRPSSPVLGAWTPEGTGTAMSTKSGADHVARSP